MWGAVAAGLGVVSTYLLMGWRWFSASRKADQLGRELDAATAVLGALRKQLDKTTIQLRKVETRYGRLLDKYADDLTIGELISFDISLHEDEDGSDTGD